MKRTLGFKLGSFLFSQSLLENPSKLGFFSHFFSLFQPPALYIQDPSFFPFLLGFQFPCTGNPVFLHCSVKARVLVGSSAFGAAAPSFCVVSLQWEKFLLQRQGFTLFLFDGFSASICSHFLLVFNLHNIKQKQHKNTTKWKKLTKLQLRTKESKQFIKYP